MVNFHGILKWNFGAKKCLKKELKKDNTIKQCIRQRYGTSLLGLEIPAPSNAIHVCASKHQSALIGGDGNLQSPKGRLRPKDYRPPSRGAKAVIPCASKKKTTSSEQGAKRSAHGERSKEQSDKAMGGPRGYVAWNNTKLLMH